MGCGEPTLYRWEEIPLQRMSPTLSMRSVFGENLTIAQIFMKKGCVVPLHRHPQEQFSYVLKGAIRFVIDGMEVVAERGQVVRIPPFAEHSAEALEDVEDLDIFSPPREDWLRGEDQYLRR